MLSRVAHSLYWMARYVERAENQARLIDVNQQLLLDFESPAAERLSHYWRPVLLSTGDEELFAAHYRTENSRTVMEFLTTDRNNPNSILSSILQSRENARTVRDQLSEELWEELNALYLFATSGEAASLFQHDPYRYYQNIRRSSLLIQGIAHATLSRTEGWWFMELGKYLERADKTTRILDIKTFLGEPRHGEAPRGFHALQWTAILRSCSAMGAYRRLHQGDILPERVLELLVFSESFSRSVRFCLQRADEYLHRISGSPRGTFCNEAERQSGRLLARLNYGSVEEIFERGLHSSLDDLQAYLNQIGEGIFHAYVLMPDQVLSDAATVYLQQVQEQ